MHGTGGTSHLLPRQDGFLLISRAGLDDEALMQMPSSSTSQRAIERQREVVGRRNVDRETLNEIILDGEFIVDKNGLRFLLHDSRQNEPNLPVFFIFATDHGLQRLRRHRHWSGDGTFKVVPTNLLQLYSLNVLIDQSSVPSAFVLMQNRQQETYRGAFTVMHENLEGIVPLSVMTDFEIAAINGFREVFGAAIPLRNCLFHLGQAVNRKLMNDGFAQIYGQNAEFKKAIRSLVALSFLQIDEVLDGYDTLRANSPQETFPIFDYFQNTYLYRVVNGERQAPLFSHYNWNMHDATVENLHRTNNAMEGWHCSFAKRFRGVHPALSKFINGIKEEEEYQRNRIRPFEIDPTRGLTETRKKKYVENDRAIKNLVLRYDNDENRNDETLLGHLRALQYRLADAEIQD